MLSLLTVVGGIRLGISNKTYKLRIICKDPHNTSHGILIKIELKINSDSY